jgi:hypothetical protein
MIESQARAAAEAGRPKGPVPPAALLSWIRQRYIELADAGEPARNVPLRDLLVWIAHFQQGPAWVELALSDTDGKVVRVQRSRAMFPEELRALNHAATQKERPGE